MGIDVIIMLVVKLISFFVGVAKGKSEAQKWLWETADFLHQKSLLSAKTLLEIEKSQSEYLDSMLDEAAIKKANEANADRPDTNPEAPSLMSFTGKPVIGYPKIVQVKGVKAPGKMKFQTRSGKPDGVLVHFTAGAEDEASSKDAIGTLKYLIKKGLGCAVVDHDGTIYVPEDWDIWKHWDSNAGRSEWRGVGSVSRKVIGLEIVNSGKLDRYGKEYYAWYDMKDGKPKPGAKPHPAPRIVGRKDNMQPGAYDPYTPEQEEAIFEICKELKARNPDFKVEWVFGHDECAVPLGRKNDPGGSLSMTMPELRAKLKEIL